MKEKKSKKQMIIILIVVLILIGVVAGSIGVIMYLNSPEYKYNQANQYEQKEQFEDALALYREIEEYNDSKEKIKKLTRKVLHLDEVVKLIDSKVLYYNGGDNTTLCQITFTEQEAKIEKVKFDGNGQQKVSTNVYEWDLDTEKIIVNNELNIGYKVENENIIFEAGKYFTTEQVKEGIQGYWKIKEMNYVLGRIIRSEYNIYIKNNKITAQSATEAAYGDADYYYNNPEEKTYSLDIGKIQAPNKDGTISGTFMGFSFNIIDGKVKVLHYGKVMEKTNKLPNVNSYKF
ncbi:MAG: hypothetical protein HFJ28_02395 [Clostridia bacterium]|jgi:hypothetical protein|nr:hypothetical protein [Clostridia bacterium]